MWARVSELDCDGASFACVQEDKLNALIKAAGVTVEPFWPSLFAKVSTLNGSWCVPHWGACLKSVVLELYFKHRKWGWMWFIYVFNDVCCRLCPASTSAAWSATLELEAAPRLEQPLPELLLLVMLQVSLVTGCYGSHSPNGTAPCMLVNEWEPW